MLIITEQNKHKMRKCIQILVDQKIQNTGMIIQPCKLFLTAYNFVLYKRQEANATVCLTSSSFSSSVTQITSLMKRQ